MNNHNYDTASLWRMLTLLIHVLLFLVIVSFMYLILEDHIVSFLNKPKLSVEQLDDIAANRAKGRSQVKNDKWDLVENGIHLRTGLKADENLQLIIGACTSCHSAKIITQNRASREGWKSMIVWMQETQGLVDLGDKESIVLDYLAKNYAPQEMGRRKNLDLAEIEWYILNLDEIEE